MLRDELVRAYSADVFSQKIMLKPELYPQYRVTDGIIYRVGSQTGKVLYVPIIARVETVDDEVVQLRTYLIWQYHDSTSAGHLGQKRTLSLLKRYFYWENMAKEVERHVRTCPQCQRIKVRTHRPYGKFNPVLPADRLWVNISLDWITDLPMTAETEYDNILVIMEMLSKRIILVPCKSTMTAEQCADVIFEKLVSQHGLPRKIFSDRDSRFTSRCWQHLWGKFVLQ